LIELPIASGLETTVMKANKIKLHSFSSILPLFSAEQQDLNNWVVNLHHESLFNEDVGDRERWKRLLTRFCVSKEQISQRFFECADMIEEKREIYTLTRDQKSGASIWERTNFYAKVAKKIFENFYPPEKRYPGHLIHVTCTGYQSPSAPQLVFSTRENHPQITHAYHMGCYASLPAVRMAMSISDAQQLEVDIVHNELCSLHLNPANHTPEQLVVQSLFADGHIKYTVSEGARGRHFEILTIHERLIPNSLGDMSWTPTPSGMKMTLSRDVPEKIQARLINFLEELSLSSGIDLITLKKSIFAIHPGGPKIIDQIQKRLELDESQVQYSRKILKNRGNMSSATLPHIWMEILESDYKGYVVSLAFGPGLTMFGAVFEAK
jgi:predicted naringenin-chalcone synthase